MTDADYPGVSETPWLREIGRFGTAPTENLLIRGDARDALRSLIALPTFGTRYVGNVQLAYIDPPFNTGYRFTDYSDRLAPTAWLSMLRDCFTKVKILLAETGSLWAHLDDHGQHRARTVLDEVFGVENFVATVVWDRANTSRATTKTFANRHDYIHVYRKSPAFSLQPVPSGDANTRRPSTVWTSGDVGSGREGSAESRRLFGEPFATPKPERLISRIIELATRPEDIVLDCFAGSGTTAAVAQKLRRRWVTVEAEEATVRDFLQPRLVRVVAGTDDGGITEYSHWTGGGGFARLNVEPPLQSP